MEVYKFDTRVMEKGIIQIPEIAKLANKKIEIFIVVKQKPQEPEKKEKSLAHFLDQWQGFLKGFDADDLRLQYLQEKYK